MQSDKRHTVALLLAFVVFVVSVPMVAGAVAAQGVAVGEHSAALPSPASAFVPATAAQAPSAIEATADEGRQEGVSFEYFMVLPGVVAALALGRLLRGAALSLQGPNINWYPLHFAWTVILFVAQIVAWRAASRHFDQDISESLLHYLSFFTFPAAIYLAASVLSPKDGSTKFSAHYHGHAARFFTTCTVGLLLAAATNTMYPYDSFGTDWRENGFRLLGAAGTAVLAWFSRGDQHREEVHYVVTAIMVLLLTGFIYLFW